MCALKYGFIYFFSVPFFLAAANTGIIYGTSSELTLHIELRARTVYDTGIRRRQEKGDRKEVNETVLKCAHSGA